MLKKIDYSDCYTAYIFSINSPCLQYAIFLPPSHLNLSSQHTTYHQRKRPCPLTHVFSSRQKRKRADEKRTRIWFPMFSYFEANVHGTVPNEFEWPLTREWLASLLAAGVEQARRLGSVASEKKMMNGRGGEWDGSEEWSETAQTSTLTWEQSR